MIKLIPGALAAAQAITAMDLDPIDNHKVAYIITKHCGSFELREAARKLAESQYRKLHKDRKAFSDAKLRSK